MNQFLQPSVLCRDPTTIQKLCGALSGYPFLLREFATLLPRDRTFEVPDDFSLARAVRIISGQSITWRAAFGIPDTVDHNVSPSSEDKVFFLLQSVIVEPAREDAARTLRRGDASRAVTLMHQVQYSIQL